MSNILTAEQRAKRLIRLYEIRARVGEEIAAIESAMNREAEALARAKAAASDLGIPMSRKRALCGTDSGYYRHIRQRKEGACDPCKLAHRMAERRRVKSRETAA